MGLAHIWKEHHGSPTKRNFSSLSIHRFLFSRIKSESIVSMDLPGVRRPESLTFMTENQLWSHTFPSSNMLTKGAFILRRNHFLFIFKSLRGIHRGIRWTSVEWDEHSNSQIPSLLYFTLSHLVLASQSIRQLLSWPRSCRGHIYHSCFPTPLHLESSLSSFKMQFK